MSCQKCGHDAVAGIQAWARDCFSVQYPDGRETDDYFPDDLGHLGCGDSMDVEICLHCGQVQGSFPIGDY